MRTNTYHGIARSPSRLLRSRTMYVYIECATNIVVSVSNALIAHGTSIRLRSAEPPVIGMVYSCSPEHTNLQKKQFIYE